MEFIWQALRQVAFLLDQAVYSLIPGAYELIFYLANINLATNDIFIAVINRIYLLLGIFMLFKVSFSIMQYLVDPNAFSDKSKGFGKLVTNSLVSVVLLAVVPWIFSTAYQLQNTIILSNVIPRVILGDTSYDDYSEGINTTDFEKKQKEIHSMAVDVQFTIFSAFYNLNTTSNGGYESCDPSRSGKTLSNVIGSSDMVTTCWSEIEQDLTEEIHKQGGTLRGLFKYCDTDDCHGADEPHDERDFATFKYLLWWMKDGGQSNFTITYIPIISCIVGGYLLLLLVTFAIDIAARVFKLMFLQMVAPIAIISHIDPKESASNGRLHNWAVECGKTYVSLFLRLAVIYLAVQLIRLLTSVVFTAMTDSGSLYYNGLAPEGTLNIFVYILLILGIFTFAKKLPQMIESIFNIKLSGELNLNPFKNNFVTAGLGIAGAGIGMAASNTLSTLSRFNKWRKDNGGLASALEGGVGRVFDNMAATGRNIKGAVGGVFDEAEMANLGKQSYGTAIRNAGRYLKMGRDETKKQWQKTATGARSAVSSVAGIATGAVSGALRGAIGGYKANDIQSVTKATLGAITEASENRNERVTRRKNEYTPGKQFMDATRTFARIKNSEAGVGAADRQITELTRAMENLREEETAARRSRTQQAVEHGIDPRTLEKVVYKGTINASGEFERLLDPAGNPQLRTYSEYIASGGSGISQDVFDSFKAASEAIDSYDSLQAQMRREISDLNKLKNQRSGDKK